MDKLSLTKRNVQFAILFSVYLTGGTSQFLWGPLWPDFTIYLGQTPETMKYCYVLQSVGSFLGALVAAPILNRLNRIAVLVIALTIIGIGSIVATFMTYTLVLVCFFVFGLAGAFKQTICTVWQLDLFIGSSSGVTIATLLVQLTYGICSVVANLLAGPFLPLKPDNRTDGGFNNSTVPLDESQLYLPVLIANAAVLLNAVVLILIVWQPMKFEITKPVESSLLSKPAGEDSTNSTQRLPFEGLKLEKYILLSLFFVFFALTVGYEKLSINYLMSFLISTELKLSDARAIFISTQYGWAQIIAVLLGIPIGFFIKPSITILFNLSLLIASSLLYLLFLDSSELFLSIATILYGAGIASAFANGLAIMPTLLDVSNGIGSIVVVAGLVGTTAFIQLFGGLITYQPKVMPQATLFASVALFLDVIGILFLAAYVRRRKGRQLSLSCDT